LAENDESFIPHPQFNNQLRVNRPFTKLPCHVLPKMLVKTALKLCMKWLEVKFSRISSLRQNWEIPDCGTLQAYADGSVYSLVRQSGFIIQTKQVAE